MQRVEQHRPEQPPMYNSHPCMYQVLFPKSMSKSVPRYLYHKNVTPTSFPVATKGETGKIWQADGFIMLNR